MKSEVIFVSAESDKISLKDLIGTALKAKLKYIVAGEVKGPEAEKILM